MNAEYIAAPGTGPSVLFLRDETPYAGSFDILQILDHAHAVSCSIPLVQMLQRITGKLAAIEAIAYFACFDHLALLDPAQDSGLGFQMIVDTAARAPVLFPDIGAAQTAVHPAGGDQS